MPDLCTILVDVHFVPGQTVDGIVADIRRALDPIAARDPELRYEIEIPPPASFKGRRRLVMDPFDMPTDAPIVQAVARSYRAVTGREPKAIGTVLPHSYSADDTCHLWKAGIPCLLYGPATIRGNADEDDACVLVSEMETGHAGTGRDGSRRVPTEAGRARRSTNTDLRERPMSTHTAFASRLTSPSPRVMWSSPPTPAPILRHDRLPEGRRRRDQASGVVKRGRRVGGARS